MKWRLKKVKEEVEDEVKGVKRFYKTMTGKKTKKGYQAFYDPNGKGFTYYKQKKNGKVKKGKRGKTGKIERGMLAVYRATHPYE